MPDEQLLAPARPQQRTAPAADRPAPATARRAHVADRPTTPAYFAATPPPAAPAVAAVPAAPAAAPAAVLPLRAVTAASALVAAVLTAFGVLIVSGRVATEGPVLLVLSRTHGVHAGDLLALAAWALAVTALVAQAVLLHRTARR